MLTAIITDQHFGCRKNSDLFHNYFLQFYEIFFKNIEDNKIKITYSKLDQAKQISFSTAGVEEKKLNFRSKSNDTFEFSDNGSAYLIDLEKSIASQIRKGETVFYQCKKSQFKM